MSEVCLVKPEVFEIDYVPEEREATFKEIWDNLSRKDVGEFIKQKHGLNFLPWSDCYSILLNEYPDAEYHTYWFPGENARWNKYCAEVTGYSVQVGITIKGIHKFTSLPIWSGRPPKAVLEPDSMDINTAIQRCGVKAVAMFGLALYLYQGEDLPIDQQPEPATSREPEAEQPPNTKPKVITTEQKNRVLVLQKQLNFDDERLAIGIKKAIGDSVAVADMTASQADVVIAKMKAKYLSE